MTTDTTCFFWKPPPEFRNIIYSAVYDERREIKVILQHGWQSWEKYCYKYQRKPYEIRRVATARDFPEGIASPLVVLKQYFDEAIGSFFRGKSVSSLTIFYLHRVQDRVQREILAQIAAVNLRDSTAINFAFDELAGMPKLRELSFNMDDAFLKLNSADETWHQDLDDARILQNTVVQAALRVRGIQKLTISCKADTVLTHPDDRAVMGRNLARAERLIREQITNAETGDHDQRLSNGHRTGIERHSCGSTKIINGAAGDRSERSTASLTQGLRSSGDAERLRQGLPVAASRRACLGEGYQGSRRCF